MSLSGYQLSDAAEYDVSDIYDYTLESFGENKAASYLLGLDEAFDLLVARPKLGRQRNEIREGLRSKLYEKHIIFYRLMPSHIRILRVLDGRSDLPTQFKAEPG